MARRMCRNTAIVAGILALLLPVAASPATAATYRTIHQFRDEASGSHPVVEVVRAADGMLYGTTRGGGAKGFGTVFRLAPPQTANGAYRYTLLHVFAGGRDGTNPLSGLVEGPGGSLFGTTESGGGGSCSGGCGTIFELAPKAGGGFVYRVVSRFDTATAGARASGSLAVRAGRIYGTTSAGGRFTGGTVWELRRVGAGWSRTILHAFRGGRNDGLYPRSGVVFGPDGALYGTTEAGGSETGGRGTVFRLALASGGVGPTTTILHRFADDGNGTGPIAPVTLDAKGTVYGTTPYGGTGTCFMRCGTVFRLAKSGGIWKATVIHRFDGQVGGAFPRGALVFDGAGRLYGTASTAGARGSFGTLFRLDPPAAAGGSWQRRILHTFAGPPGDGATPFGGLTRSGGAFWGTTRDGGGEGLGTVFSATP
ncbi:choice-of-anchor tandem repeat GloVer-containing protein [Oharaeibacter diazotrophicus]|uniref:Putative repeat protein (TIGR03803 family) n=2 Tax=Oharaeibacter diazotrophicus TaxID=1920512 RepID=A0A4R6RKA8_9HYPH|nr:choice-of-anchor tandem repeat GloVer-containing protein [Oharaeibacter diazotrophicus]TDP86993.1 putative repeat protein (TIGR03803 family) [Oharaeibacter diazotrophicus]BBE71064.1 hypothetical protein OHA_1_00634 [Pleomorphomonas sp. SM30]GLS77815.1 hypothetical protein GCM10007904_31520 [Oharaeibacter diazotrophicus]